MLAGSVFAGGAIAGCGDASTQGADASVVADARPSDAARIEVTSYRAMTLRQRSEAFLGFRVTTADGAPWDGVPIEFAIDGRPNGASLLDTSAVSGPDGAVMVGLTTGSAPATFRVRASTAEGAAAYVDIDVFQELGGIVVAAQYGGNRAVGETRAFVVPDLGCDALPTNTTSLMQRALPTHSSEAQFVALDAERSYAVFVRATGIASDPDRAAPIVAAGCRDGVMPTTPAGRVDLTLSDVPLDWSGSYDFRFALEGAEALPATSVTPIDTMFGEDPTGASLVLDTLAATIARLHDGAAAAMFEELRSTQGYDASLANAFPAGVRALPARTTDALHRAFVQATTLEATGITRVVNDAAAFEVQALRVGGPDALPIAPSVFEIDALYAGMVQRAGETWTLSPLDVNLPLGTMVFYVWRSDTSAPFRPIASEDGLCTSFQTWVARQEMLPSLCDRGCSTTVCADVGARIESAMRETQVLLDAQYRTVRLAGHLVVEDADGDLRVDRFAGATESGSLSVSWTPGPNGAVPVTATFEGTRPAR